LKNINTINLRRNYSIILFEMNEIVKIVCVIMGVFSLIGYITFYLNIMPKLIRVSQGDSNATQEIVQDLAEEASSTLMTQAVISLLIAIASALGLTWLVALLKKV